MGERSQLLEFCWEQILRVDPWFRLNFLFAPREMEERVLGLHGLFASIDLALRIEEPGLSRARLAWLATELGSAVTSEFPIVNLLHRTGALERIPAGLMSALLEDAHSRAEPEPFSNIADLKRTVDRVGWVRMALEFSMSDFDQNLMHPLQEHGAGSGIHYLMRAGKDARSDGMEFLPLELVARHQVRASDLSGNSRAEHACREAFRSLAAGWAGEQSERLWAAVEGSDARPSAFQHMAAFLAVRYRQFRKWELMVGGDGARWGIVDLFSVWTRCRGLRGQASPSRS